MYLFLMGYVAYYLTGFVGVAVVTASSFSMAMRVWDGVTDPFIGYFVDKTNGKFGKNRPFMIIGQIILCVMSFILFHVTHRLPENTAIRFGFFNCNFCNLLYRIHIPMCRDKISTDLSYKRSETETSVFHF